MADTPTDILLQNQEYSNPLLKRHQATSDHPSNMTIQFDSLFREPLPTTIQKLRLEGGKPLPSDWAFNCTTNILMIPINLSKEAFNLTIFKPNVLGKMTGKSCSITLPLSSADPHKEEAV